MKRWELIASWVIAALPPAFLILLVSTNLHERTEPLSFLAFVAVLYFKEWMLRGYKTKTERRADALRETIMKWHPVAITFTIVVGIVVLSVAMYLLTSGLEALGGKNALLVVFVSLLAGWWLMDCKAIWKQFKSAPNQSLHRTPKRLPPFWRR